MDIALADVMGLILQRQSEPTDVKLSPETVLSRCSELLLELLKATIIVVALAAPGAISFFRRRRL
jgi:hypothetical protein